MLVVVIQYLYLFRNTCYQIPTYTYVIDLMTVRHIVGSFSFKTIGRLHLFPVNTGQLEIALYFW